MAVSGGAGPAGQALLPGFGVGQARLAAARMRVMGDPAETGAALIALAQAGVGWIWIDDAWGAAEAGGGWLLPPGAAGAARAAAELRGFSRALRVEPYPAGGVPSATLVCAPDASLALAAAEQARRARVPHAVVEPGAVVVVPPGAPCYACARAPGAGGHRTAGPAAAALGALELALAVALPAEVVGRRIELVRGLPTARPTSRRETCACGTT